MEDSSFYGLSGRRRAAPTNQQPGVTQLRQRKTFVGKALQKVSRGVAKVGLAPIRNAWLLAMKLNVKGIAAKLRFGYATPALAARFGYDARQWQTIRGQLLRAQKSFVKAGGKAENLKKAILNGKGKGGHAVSGLAGSPQQQESSLSAILGPIAAILEAIASVLNAVKPGPVHAIGHQRVGHYVGTVGSHDRR